MRPSASVRLLPQDLLEFLGVPAVLGLDPHTQSFCLELDERTITQVLVDFRPSASIASPVKPSVGHDQARRICDRWKHFQAAPQLSELHGKGLLSVTALVATESKKELIRKAVQEEMRDRPAVQLGPLKFGVVPELLHLIGQRGKG